VISLFKSTLFSLPPDRTSKIYSKFEIWNLKFWERWQQHQATWRVSTGKRRTRIVVSQNQHRPRNHPFITLPLLAPILHNQLPRFPMALLIIKVFVSYVLSQKKNYFVVTFNLLLLVWLLMYFFSIIKMVDFFLFQEDNFPCF
jgi:hypothetical protein